MSSFEIVRLIDKHPQCIIYELRHTFTKQSACVKIITYRNEGQLSKIVNEVMNLSRIGNLSMGLKVYGFDSRSDGLKSILKSSSADVDSSGSNIEKHACIITEFCQNGDLCNHIKARKKHNNPYSYKEIKSVISTFIDFFAELQNLKIAHRDIKPQNIYVTNCGEYKVGDFGSSKFLQFDQNEHTISGTTNYLSPEMRHGYREYDKRNGGLHIEYDPIKSDVFSLGLVFIYFIRMELIGDDDENLQLFEEKINIAIGKYPYGIVREILHCMLKFKINERHSFVDIQNGLIPILLSKKCIKCIKEIPDQSIYCTECNIGYHVECASNLNKCLNCELDLNIRCCECSGVSKLLCGSHKLCEQCSVKNSDCPKCFGLQLYEGKNDKFNFYVDDFYCFSCEILLVPSKGHNSTICERCQNTWCKLCKRATHPLGCSRDPSPLSVICKCRRKSISPFSGLFFQCENCGPICIVCLGSSEKGHLRCAQALNQVNN